MDTNAFFFELPPSHIAQHPPSCRENARLCCVRPGQPPVHRLISALPEHVRPGDLWVFNNTRVVKARLLGRKRKTGGRVELLVVEPAEEGLGMQEGLVRPLGEGAWRCLGKAGKGLKPGEVLEFSGASAVVYNKEEGGFVLVGFEGEGNTSTNTPTSMSTLLEAAGHTPLPPYIRRAPTDEDAQRYQTVFAASEGSVAAPTAGLHFSPALMEALQAKGARLACICLDIGLGTFMPVRSASVQEHRMHEERCSIGAEAARAVKETRAAGGRVVAVGTTVVRCLESFATGEGEVEAGCKQTRIFIFPGYRFRVVDAMLTNFHLPGSTLLMLVAAFLGREKTLATYAEAVQKGYRFYSFGDAMFLEKG